MDDDDPAASSLDRLLEQTPDGVERWLTGPVPEAFNLPGLAFAAGRRALPVEAVDLEVALAWARVAVLVYEVLGTRADSDREEARYVRDTMRLRADLVLRHGSEPGHVLLDCDDIIEWFLDGRSRHDDKTEAVSRDCHGWRELPIERIGELRDIKHDLAVIRRLEQRCPAYGRPDVQAWLELWDQLP